MKQPTPLAEVLPADVEQFKPERVALQTANDDHAEGAKAWISAWRKTIAEAQPEGSLLDAADGTLASQHHRMAEAERNMWTHSKLHFGPEGSEVSTFASPEAELQSDRTSEEVSLEPELEPEPESNVVTFADGATMETLPDGSKMYKFATDSLAQVSPATPSFSVAAAALFGFLAGSGITISMVRLRCGASQPLLA